VKRLALGATRETGQLIACDALAKGHSVVALVRAKACALALQGADMIKGGARDEGASFAPWTAAI
jgi:putative NADH-flavin reductase